uniref:Uncharacterized protein n=1 Tax=Arundo donax TaxID=35708 RepID=A0A0A9DNB4_ARUDO
MLGGVEHALGLPEGSLQQPIYTRVQLWGSALPMNTPGMPCIFDPLGRAGICSDWLTGSSIEAAVLSGMSLVNHVNSDIVCYFLEHSTAHRFINKENN